MKARFRDRNSKPRAHPPGADAALRTRSVRPPRAPAPRGRGPARARRCAAGNDSCSSGRFLACQSQPRPNQGPERPAGSHRLDHRTIPRHRGIERLPGGQRWPGSGHILARIRPRPYPGQVRARSGSDSGLRRTQQSVYRRLTGRPFDRPSIWPHACPDNRIRLDGRRSESRSSSRVEQANSRDDRPDPRIAPNRIITRFPAHTS